MRLTPQIIILLGLCALVAHWFFRSFLRLHGLRVNLERQFSKIEQPLFEREKKLSLLEKLLEKLNLEDQRIKEALKSMNYIHQNIHFDFQLQQQKISNQLKFIFRYLQEHKLNDSEYVELRGDFYQLDESIQSESMKFNNMVDHYNQSLNALPASWVADHLGFFEAEPFELQPLDKTDTPL